MFKTPEEWQEILEQAPMLRHVPLEQHLAQTVREMREENAALRARVKGLEEAGKALIRFVPYGEPPEVVEAWDKLREALGLA